MRETFTLQNFSRPKEKLIANQLMIIVAGASKQERGMSFKF